MNDELFPVESVTMLSPRLRWMRFYGVTVKEHDWTDTDLEGTDEPRFQCLLSEIMLAKSGRWEDDGPCCDTEDQAIEALAIQMGWPLWNEEPEPKDAKPHDVERAGNY